MAIENLPAFHEFNDDRRTRYRKAAERLQQWSVEDYGYDERVGQLLADELKDLSLRCVDRDASSA